MIDLFLLYIAFFTFLLSFFSFRLQFLLGIEFL